MSRERAAPIVLAAALASAAASPLDAQAPPPASPPTAAYEPPMIALVQPPAGGSIPADKPIVVFRFAAGEPGDPIDARSFAITVDGQDRTSLFQVTASEAWGALRDARSLGAGSAPASDTHSIAARICSARGTCASIAATVAVASSPAVAPAEAGSRRDRLLDLLLRAARRLLLP